MSDRIVKSCDRTLLILEYFDQVQRSVTLKELSEQLDLPKSSAMMLLRSMTSLGYTHYDRARRCYRPTARLSLLGNWASQDVFRNGNLIELMQRLHDITGETVVLASICDNSSQYIRVVQNNEDRRTVYRKPGTKRSLFKSSTGHVLLADLKKPDLLNIIKRVNADRTEGEEPIRLDAVQADIERVWRDGFAHSEGWVVPGISMIAMPLPLKDHGMPLAIGVARRTPQMEETRTDIEDLMKATIQRYLKGY